MTFKLLDLCCGKGGWTNGFKAEGFECIGVDIRNNIDYKGKLIVKDVFDFDTNEPFDVIVASPPCTEFSIAKKIAWGTQDERIGLDCVYRCFYLISKIKPKYWILENVRDIKNFIPGYIEIIFNKPRTKDGKQWVLYGNFPKVGMFEEHYIWSDKDKGARDMIPYPMARAFAKAIKKALLCANIRAQKL